MSPSLWAQSNPTVGRGAAEKYFTEDVEPAPSMNIPSQNLLMLHLGTYNRSEAYKWKGDQKRTDLAKVSYGLTYLFEQWTSVDMFLRADFNEYVVDGTRAMKMSILPLWTIPMAANNFPLYFGIGAGVGIFFSQVDNESNLSLDYQLVAGARFTDLYEGAGFFVEYGLKNHFHLLSDGQFNGTVLSAGAVFNF